MPIRGMSGEAFQLPNHSPNPNPLMNLCAYGFDDDHSININGGGSSSSSSNHPCAAADEVVVPAVVDKDLEFSEIFSDINLGYITKMIMEENMEDKGYMHQGDSSLFCGGDKPEVGIAANPTPHLGTTTITTLPDPPLHNSGVDAAGQGGAHHSSDDDDENSAGGNGLEDNCWVNEFLVSSRLPTAVPVERSPLLSNKSNAAKDEPQLGNHTLPGLFLEKGMEPLWRHQFNKGMEEANKFIPDVNKLVLGLGSNWVPPKDPNGAKDGKSENERRPESRGRKKPNDENLDLKEGRNVKQLAAYEEGVIRSKMFDDVLLWKNGTCTDTISELIETLRNEASQSTKRGQSSGSSDGRSGGKRQGKKGAVDLRALLIHCAQSVAADDRRNANELLKQIRQHSSSASSGASGDAMQKLAQIFADGLEARLAGTGSRVYHSLMSKKQAAVDILKAYRLHIAACPFRRISHFFANRTILNVAKKATRLHIIDFGINFGFQWPCLIQQLPMLGPGGPPKLRITGIDVPQRGFRPAERIDETGRRLADYCKTFKVPFEYHAIAAKWEDIEIEDLKISKDEVLVVNCLYRFRNLADEMVLVDSPRDIMLNNIRKMNPDVFVHGVINGSYGVPFFVTRFREALFFYSSLFDMLETTIPRDHPEKLLIENEIFGREAINVVACEGAEREERPETYKQWQLRSLRAGFKQLPLNQDILKASKDKVRSSYHKDFIIDADGRWLLQGWKGRIICALCAWIPTAKGF